MGTIKEGKLQDCLNQVTSLIKLTCKDHPHGFDIVVEATGVEKLANDAINYVRRGGTLMLYGVYEKAALVHWSPMRIFNDEINVALLSLLLDQWLITVGRSSDRSLKYTVSLAP
jgi:threonine dehydrogenase-like Zn-dependent dehydrogenase